MVKFLHFPTKQQILHKARAIKDLQLNGKHIALDRDYYSTVQCKPGEYKKECNIKFKSEIQKVLLEDGEVGYNSACKAAENARTIFNSSGWRY